ncbi:tRNA-specific adenosine deaminase 2 like protein [Verticillium longisporum]|nr:tRNA-specific adenosine deaminase 2 like protein [Verticillium longisporum]
MARLALRTNETPVGCVVVHNNKVIAKGMNATNVTRNGTRHAEFMAVSALLSYRPVGVTSDDAAAEPRHVPTEMSAAEREQRDREKDAELGPDPSLKDTSYVKNGHLYPQCCT